MHESLVINWGALWATIVFIGLFGCAFLDFIYTWWFWLVRRRENGGGIPAQQYFLRLFVCGFDLSATAFFLLLAVKFGMEIPR